MSTTTTTTTTTNLFLQGPFAPVAEEVTVTDLAVTGSLPEALDGRYLRNGPNPVVVDPDTYHWFLGDGMVHGIRLRDGRAEWYRNRWVRTVEVSEALGEPRHPGAVYFGRFQPPNTNVIGHGGRFFAIAESGVRPYELTGELDTVGPCSFDTTLPGGYTAHPHRDPATGELHAVAYFVGEDDELRYQYLVLGTDCRINRVVDLDITGNPMMHDFALTESHVVLFDLPLTVEMSLSAPEASGRAPTSGPHADSRGVPYLWDADDPVFPARWNPDHPARVGLLPRDGGPGDVRWFPVEPCFVFHPLNAYEQGNQVVVDVVRYPTMFASPGLAGPDAVPTLDRWTLDLGTGRVREDRVDDRMQEFPRLDERRIGLPHRYGYTVGIGGGLFKHDFVAGTTTVQAFEPGDVPGEFVFVPTDTVCAEDDGVLLGLVERAATGRSDLVVLDAAGLDPVATVHLPVRVPFGFHGNWIPS